MPKRTRKCTRVVIGGVDTHGRAHHAAVIDQQGRLLGDREFPADSGGYRQLLGWLCRHGHLDTVGVEGTGSYGAGLTRFLLDHRVGVVEVDRPDRRLRRQRGKSDPIDAEAAARAVLAGWPPPRPSDATASWSQSGRCARRAAARSRPGPPRPTSSTACWSPLPQSCASPWTHCPPPRWSPPAPDSAPDETALADPRNATKAALRVVACRIHQLDEELSLADQRLAKLVGRAAPRLRKLHAVGVDHAGQLLTTAGQRPERLGSEAAFTHLCGVAPIPASSGTTHRHRLHRGGDRGANRALHLAVVVRMRWCPRTRGYAERRTTQGMSKPEIIRCVIGGVSVV